MRPPRLENVNMDMEEMQKNAKHASALLAAMANEKRLMILCQLVDGERSVTALAEALGTRQSTVSQHLALLRKEGFVESRREGQTQYYSLAADEARTLLETLYSLYCAPRVRPTKPSGRAPRSPRTAGVER
jgi:ArsR family transcriptional regulator, virulence genes transcriptional regulator